MFGARRRQLSEVFAIVEERQVARRGASESAHVGDLDVGIGYGLTAASNGLALKLGIGHQY